MMPTYPRNLLPNLVAAAVLFLVAGSVYGQSSGVAFTPLPEGQRVTRVRIVDQSGTVQEENPKDLPLQPGEPFKLAAEQASFRQLFRSGRYADIVAQTSPVEGGLRLDFVVKRNFYVNDVRVVGLHEPPSDAQAVSSMRLNLGEIFRESEMPAALDRLRHTLEAEGLYQAKIEYHLQPHPDTRQMDITVNVTPGPRARVGSITVVNKTPFQEGGVREQLKLKLHREITSESLNRSVERARKWLVKRGYLGARITIVRGIYDPKTNQVPLEVQVAAGLNMHVQVDGAKISTRKLRQLLPLYAEGAVDEDLLEEGRRNLRSYLEGQGYFDAQVTYTTSQTPAKNEGASETPASAQGSEIITYHVNRGAHGRVAGMSFTGNHYFNDQLLRSRVRIQAAAFTSPGQFSTAQLAADVASITALYQANGFLQVQVKSEVMQKYQGKAGQFFVRFEVQEGPQTRIASLKLEGNHALSDAELLRVIGSTAGQPFSDFNVAGDRDNVLALYYNQGFPEARFQTQVHYEAPVPPEGPRASLTYQIEEGAQVRVARVLLSGEEYTRPGVILNEIQIQAGHPLSQSAVVETQRRLYGLAIFNRVTIAPQNPTGTDPEKTVDVLVEEAKRYTIAYGLGLEAQRLGSPGTGPVAQPLRFSPRVTFEVTKLNVSGRADILSFKVRASTLQGRGLLDYTARNIFGNPKLTLDLTALFDKTRDVLTFTSTRSQGSAQITYRMTTATSFLFLYSYRHVLASNLEVQPEEIPLFSQPTEVSFFSVSWLRDRRDNPTDPVRGTFNSIDVDYASRSIGSSASFLRVTGENSTYTRIGTKFIFARSTRMGIEQTLGQTTAINIPLPERFFAGGGTTIRGFGLNQAGPRDSLTGFPVGGMAMLAFKQQLQFPMRLPLLGNRVGGAIFYDAGNVFSSLDQITFRTRPPEPVFNNPAQPNVCQLNCSNQLNYFSHTVGFELRYHTPVGPVSIDLAYQLNPAHFLIPTGSTSGVCATTTCLTTSRLPAFQFFVNLGSTF